MTVKTLIEKLSHYNKDAIVRLHHREGEELLFALAFKMTTQPLFRNRK